MTLTPLPISGERRERELIFSETEWVPAAIFSMVLAAACMTCPPWAAVSAETRLAVEALSALRLISPMVEVISPAAVAIWVVMADWFLVLMALSPALALIWV